MGGGDVKLLGASALGVAPGSVLTFIAAVAIAGGALAIFYLMARSLISASRKQRPVGLLARAARVERWRIRRGGPLPYACAIAAGASFFVNLSGSGLMILRLAVFALMSLGLIGFGTVAWISTRPPPPDAATVAASTRVMVLVAAHPITAGNLLKPEDLTAKAMTLADAGDGASIDTSDSRHALAGAMVRESLDINEVVKLKDVMRPGDHGFLAAVLRPGMVSVSVAVDAVTGTAGLIWPGDRVDLILTQAIGDVTLPIGHRIAAETVLSDVRVIAIDQQLMQGVAPGSAENKAPTVTMEVTSAQAELVSVATRIGKLSLAVRSADHTVTDDKGARPTTVWASDVSPALGADVAQGSKGGLFIFHGAADGKEFKF